MVKGLRDNLDVILGNNLPIIIETTLLMFKDNIVYNSFVNTYPISMGNNTKELIIKDCKYAIKC